MPNQMNRLNDDGDLNLENMNESPYLAVDTSAAKMLTSPLLQVMPGNQQMQMRLQLPPPPTTSIQLMPLINTGMPTQLLQQPPPTSPNQQPSNMRFHSPMRGGYLAEIN